MSLLALLGLLAGCALGGMARVAVAARIGTGRPGSLPWNTLTVNTSGAFALGLLAGWLDPGSPASVNGLPWLALGMGFLGSYTTVSSFSLQTVVLLREGHAPAALANVALSLGLCLGALLLGLQLGQLVGAAI